MSHNSYENRMKALQDIESLSEITIGTTGGITFEEFSKMTADLSSDIFLLVTKIV